MGTSNFGALFTGCRSSLFQTCGSWLKLPLLLLYEVGGGCMPSISGAGGRVVIGDFDGGRFLGVDMGECVASLALRRNRFGASPVIWSR